ncbi:MAG: PDZ domain-containing protein [Armatimonadetes bacterium]|nr:PDZ domain-containing protein [Armatimonadota bacterium]
MNDFGKAVFATVAVIGCVAAYGGGYFMRTRVDMGSTPNTFQNRAIFASNEDTLSGVSGDTAISDEAYFYEVTELLRRTYVDPVNVDYKMSSGAVRGMISSLLDPDSQFMNEEQFKAFQNFRHGKIEGIGVELSYDFDEETIKQVREKSDSVDPLLLLPEIHISAVLPGTPAEKAGLKVGDEIRKIDDKFLITATDIKKLRDLQTKVTEGKATADELRKASDMMNEMIKSNLAPGKVREKLTVGTVGSLDITVNSAGSDVKFKVNRASVVVPPLEGINDATANLKFFVGASDEMRQALKSGVKAFDLRNSTLGDVTEMKNILAMFLGEQEVGSIVSDKPIKRTPVTITGRKSEDSSIHLIVDDTVRGAARIFTQVMVGSGMATVEFADGSKGDLSEPAKWIEVFDLPDGSGYTLRTGIFEPKNVSAQLVGEAQ